MQQISSLTGRLWRFSSYHNQREVRGLNAESTYTSLACINKLSKNHYFPSFEHQIMTHEGNGCFSYDLWLTSARVDSDIIIHGDVKSCLTSLPLIKRSSSHLKRYCLKMSSFARRHFSVTEMHGQCALQVSNLQRDTQEI